MRQLLVSLTCLVAAPVIGQSYPVKPIEMISPTSAGGGSDLVARVVADIILKEKLLPQPVIIQNRAGGGGAVGQAFAASKRGDPYFILLAGTGLITVPLRTGLDVGIDKFQERRSKMEDLVRQAQPQGAPAESTADSNLRKLSDLHDAGILTDEEYEAKKAHLQGGV